LNPRIPAGPGPRDEDVPFDMRCHVDTEGRVFDYVYGMNRSGVIIDARTVKAWKGWKIK
jgi:hypothetical protein